MCTEVKKEGIMSSMQSAKYISLFAMKETYVADSSQAKKILDKQNPGHDVG